jgi:hypothetical protein
MHHVVADTPSLSATLRLVAVAGCAAMSTAQRFDLPASRAPATTELEHVSRLPFMTPACRLQLLYDERELAGASPLVVSRVGLRFDGPSAGVARAHTVAHFTARLGVTQIDSARAGSVFAANRTQALTTALNDVRFDFVSDARRAAGANSPRRASSP